MTDEAKKDTFDSWAVIELFGHTQIAGRVTEQTIGGTAFLRVDVPEQPEVKATQAWDRDSPAIPAYTRFFGSGAIYALNPCSEEAAKATAAHIRKRPVIAAAFPANPPSVPMLEQRDPEDDDLDC